MNLAIRLTLLTAVGAHLFAKDFALMDTAGKMHTAAEWRSQKAVALFVTPGCPVGDSYVPEINRIAQAYASRGVVAYAVESDAAVTASVAARHASEFQFQVPMLVDQDQVLVRLAGATVTPQAAVLNPAGKLLYRGRIDNRVEDFGKQRSWATSMDLRTTLDAVLAGKPVPNSITKSIGCAIQLKKNTVPTPTYNADIAPILHQNCAVCHRSGEVAPFPLLTYEDAAKRAGLIAAVTGKRFMPPWKPEAGHGLFKDERRLSARQIELLAQWAAAGAPEGDSAQRRSPPEFPSGWRAGKPDQVVAMPQAFSVPADGQDVMQCFVLPLDFKSDRYIKTVEFHPGNSRIVHHALFFLDTSGAARKLDVATPEPGYPCFGGPGIAPSGALGGWAPGATPQALPEGLAFTVGRTADIVMQVHYHPSGKPESDQSSVGLTFTDAPRRGLARMLVGTRLIDLAPGDPHHEVVDWIQVPQDVELLHIAPHAHLLCKEVNIDAHLPDGSIQPLISIRDWDFNWQGEYRYAEPVKLPKGTRIRMRYVYDNSAENPHNPSNPPKRVTFGEHTTDEMALAFLLVALPHPEDLPEFRRTLTLSVLNQFFDEGGDPMAITPVQIKSLRDAIQTLDVNHNGKLDPEERLAVFQFLKLTPK